MALRQSSIYWLMDIEICCILKSSSAWNYTDFACTSSAKLRVFSPRLVPDIAVELLLVVHQ